MMQFIPGYDNRYMIDEYGTIVNDKFKTLTPHITNNGRLKILLQEPGSSHRKNELVHRLVAKTFLPNPDNLPVVMHLDNNPLNNHVSNLKWGTQSENIKQAYREGRKVTPNPKKEIMVYTQRQLHRFQIGDGENAIICDNIKEAANLIGYTEGSTKHIAGRNGIISKGPYKGQKIRKIR